jgi:hypothetical protein
MVNAGTMALAREHARRPHGGCGSVWRTESGGSGRSSEREQAVAYALIRCDGLAGEYCHRHVIGAISARPKGQMAPVAPIPAVSEVQPWTWFGSR